MTSAADQSWPRAVTLSQLEAVPLPAVLISASQRILGANKRAARLFGTDIEGRHFITVLRQPALLDAIESTFRDHSQRRTGYLGSDGVNDLNFQVTCSHVLSAEGEAVLVCFEDRSQFEQAEQSRRDFVANVSHELRTPLTAMIGFIETLLGPAREDAAARERFLGIMLGEAQRMERLVRELLSLSRVESQERLRPSAPVDIDGLLGAVVKSMAPLAGDADVVLDYQRASDGAAVVSGDADQLRQVFTNLIENAIKYGGRGKRVDITLTILARDLSVRAPAVVVAVRDQGPGLAPEHIPRLTERFYRADTHRSRQMGGTGLGLAIVKHILNRHRGRLRIDSEIGKGSEFKVILPVS